MIKMANSAQLLTERSGINAVLTLEGKIDGTDSPGWKRRNWTVDTEVWTNVKDYSELNRNAEYRTYWKDRACLPSKKEVTSEWVSSFLTAHQHILGCSVPEDGMEDVIKEWRYNQGYLATIKYKKSWAEKEEWQGLYIFHSQKARKTAAVSWQKLQKSLSLCSLNSSIL